MGMNFLLLFYSLMGSREGWKRSGWTPKHSAACITCSCIDRDCFRHLLRVNSASEKAIESGVTCASVSDNTASNRAWSS